MAPVRAVLRSAALGLIGSAFSIVPICAQATAHLGIHVEVAPPALRVTVTSARVDFGRQQANAGQVILDPATGEITRKGAGRHQVGQVQVSGPAGTPLAIQVAALPYLLGTGEHISFGMRWARSHDCAHSRWERIPGAQGATGLIGRTGCSAWRFGGAITLTGQPAGRYRGSLQVRIVPL